MLAEAARGAGYVLQGLRLIARPGLRKFVVIPLTINILVFAVLGVLAVEGFERLLAHFLPSGEAWWWVALRGALWLVFALAFTLIAYFSFTVVANLVGAPFNGFLADAVERHLRGGAPAPAPALGVLLSEVPGAVGNELRKLLYYLAWMLPALALFWVPVLTVAAPLLWAFLMAWFLAVEYVDYPMSNHALRLVEVRRSLRKNRMLSLGFGGLTMALTAVPIINLVIMPAAVAGATVMWVRELDRSAER